MPESVTHVPGLICYLCTWTIPERSLTKASSGAREANFAWYIGVYGARPLMRGVRCFQTWRVAMSQKSKTLIKGLTPVLLVCTLSWLACAQSVCQCKAAGIYETTRPGADELITIVESKPRKSIAGIVNDVNGQPLKGVLVEVFAHTRKNADDEGRKRLIGCTTDGGGRFCFRNVPAGKYYVLFSLDGGWKHTSFLVVVAPGNRKSVNRGIEVWMQVGT
jgi:hypothetical protein